MYRFAGEGSDLADLDDTVDLPHDAREIVIGVSAGYRGVWRARGALVSYALLDDSGSPQPPNSKYWYSAAAGHYFYLDLEESDEPSPQSTVEVISVPVGCRRLRLRGRNWQKGMTAVLHDAYVVPVPNDGLPEEVRESIPEWLESRIPTSLDRAWNRRQTDRGPVEVAASSDWKSWAIAKEIKPESLDLDFNRTAYRAPSGAKQAHRFKVALICDEFTFNSFAPEFEYKVLSPDTWRESLEEFEPDLLLCESAWSGVDSVARPWRGKVYTSAKFRHENRTELLGILDYCRGHRIPSVFWNKEDPTHFFDRVNNFVDTAALFDHVLTTAVEMVPEYEKFLPSSRVGVLQFAVQPREFHPIGRRSSSNSAIFAGAWYDVHPERSAVMRRGFEWALRSGRELVIYDRNLRSIHGESAFPQEYAQYVRPAVSHRATANLYRSADIGLNFNTVVDSHSMFARRVFELAATGALVASNYSPGIDEIYGENVLYFDRGVTGGDLSEADRESRRLAAQSITLGAHTYRHRFEQILRQVGLPFTSSRPNPTLMVVVETEGEAERALAVFHQRRQEFERLLLVVGARVPSSLTGGYLIKYASSQVDVIALDLVRTEKVPSTNFLTTPDVIWAEANLVPTTSEVRALLLHGEYSRLPMVRGSEGVSLGARAISPGMRVSACDVVSALLDQTAIRPVLEVPA